MDVESDVQQGLNLSFVTITPCRTCARWQSAQDIALQVQQTANSITSIDMSSTSTNDIKSLETLKDKLLQSSTQAQQSIQTKSLEYSTTQAIASTSSSTFVAKRKPPSPPLHWDILRSPLAQRRSAVKEKSESDGQHQQQHQNMIPIHQDQLTRLMSTENTASPSSSCKWPKQHDTPSHQRALLTHPYQLLKCFLAEERQKRLSRVLEMIQSKKQEVHRLPAQNNNSNNSTELPMMICFRGRKIEKAALSKMTCV